MGLLDEIRKQAEDIKRGQANQSNARAENFIAVQRAMISVLRYSVDLFKQLEVVQPKNPVEYVIPNVATIGGLSFVEAFVDSRRKKIGERETLDFLTLMVTWAADSPVTARYDMPPLAQRARDVLWEHGLRFGEREIAVPGSSARGVELSIPRRLVTHITVTANFEAGSLDMKSRNLTRFGHDDFRVPIAQFNDTINEDIAQAILGRRSGLARFRAVLPREVVRASAPPSVMAR
jgi:hypothetical protein